MPGAQEPTGSGPSGPEPRELARHRPKALGGGRSPRQPVARLRRDLEYDYLAASYQLAELLEERLRQRQLWEEVGLLERHLSEFLAARPEARLQRVLLDQVAPVLKELASLLPLQGVAAGSLVRCQELHQRLIELGQALELAPGKTQPA